jgi:DNA invertase Pin-like site-specific DNA recombinase
VKALSKRKYKKRIAVLIILTGLSLVGMVAFDYLYGKWQTERLMHSVSAQVSYYSSLIENNPEWEYAGVYADSGISGLSIAGRDEFSRMLADCDAGKIELLISIMSSLAQEESRSISENCTWGHRKRMADGKFSVAYTHFLGYDKGENGELVINPEQAEIVRYIFRLFLEGKTTYQISKILTESEYRTVTGNDNWQKSTVINILKNEKYKGDALLQKTYTVDFLTKRHKKNRGEIQQYYVSENHEAIIPPEIWDLVQEEFVRRGSHKKGCGCFSNMLRCGVCGEFYCRKIWHSNDKYKKAVWQCRTKSKCKTPHITEEEIKEKFISAFNELLSGRSEMLAAYDEIRSTLFNEEEWSEKMQKAYEAVKQKEQKLHDFCENPLCDDFDRIYDSLNSDVTKAQENYKHTAEEYSSARYRFHQTNRFYSKLRKQTALVTEFDEFLWYALIDCIKIYSKEKIVVVFKDGTEI